MKPLLKIALVIALVFASTFVVARLTGIFSADDIALWLEQAKTLNTAYVAAIVMLLLLIDIFIAVPTLTICILAGYFLGSVQGGISAALGMFGAGLVGYGMSYWLGERLLKVIVKTESKREEAKSAFLRYGFVMILLSRGSPILSEVSACMAGMARMHFLKFWAAWSINTVPYAFIASYAGSVSSWQNPKPAIYAAIALYMTLWLAWFFFRKWKLAIRN